MPTADINGIKMNYSIVGEGKPVILVTGFGGDINFFHSLIPMLSDRYKVLVFDNRGAGMTEYQHPFTGQDMVDDLEALMDHLSIFKAHLLGWSLGGHIAQTFAIQHPDRLYSLTLMSSYMRRPARSSYMMNGAVDAGLDMMSMDCINLMVNAFCFTEDYFAAKEMKGAKIRSAGTATTKGLKDQMAALDGFDTRETARMITAPTLSIHGLDDIMVEPKMGDDLAAQIEGCRTYRIPNIGHVIHPSLYVEALRNHLANNS